MATSISGDSQGTSTRPYLIRALHDWCTDNGFTPYIAVYVDGQVQVPMEYVKNNEIVLNVAFEATSGLQLGNQTIEFKARFGGAARDIVVPIDHVVAIYARENGQGMAFPMPTEMTSAPEGETEASAHPSARPPTPLRSPLRLARSEAEPPAAAAEDAPGTAAGPVDDAPTDPPPPMPPGAPRPSLKRVK
jgi:stringent starvation protein B